MRIAIYGAGGVGGYYGGVLARAGCEVALLARGGHLAAIRQAGLHVRSPRGGFLVRPAAATDDPGEIGPVDIVIVAVKSSHLPAVRDGIAPLLGPETLVVPFLNGVDAHESLVPAVGRARMGKGLTRIISEIAAPGEIRHVGVDPYVAMAEWDGSASARVDALVAALRDAGVDAEVPPDIDAALWLKFLFICSVGGVGAACRMPLGTVRTLPETRALLRRAMEEIVAVAVAHGVSLSDEAVTFAMNTVDTFPPEGTSSLQRDIVAGLPSELDAWSGAAARLGAEAGVPTPVHSFIHAVLLPAELEARRAAKTGTFEETDRGSRP
ncbi:MAG: 2-dehydropantoate 2-reductase [Gemmatimonadetes bacterium]|nr:2-dehydropantoate 2-reductase [Gemmatimonadota bacterium]MCY3677275.1 2-dehydropantoate 2-reductase [Gemmatimonadota bacterium]MYA43946.1 2-dehydropantoate 2-reductase [Gemmatimonadota bacterium]MYE94074.1 2-dehydropantoate 2-reductase [Gemmatimonadota bacterium]MYJ11130.1 2-dehydropantoate 2-reductase [Gemmatimonadota bacterium]